MTNKICANCSSSFSCGNNSQQACWCSQLPPIMPLDSAQDCRCPQCLKLAVKQEIEQFLQKNPVTTMIPQQYHNAQLIEDIDYYLEQGKWVFTEWYHRKRGYCCGNGCRHCPYGHQSVR